MHISIYTGVFITGTGAYANVHVGVSMPTTGFYSTLSRTDQHFLNTAQKGLPVSTSHSNRHPVVPSGRGY